MDKYFIIAIFITFLFSIFKFLEMKYIEQEFRPLKYYFRDSIIVFITSTIILFIFNQLDVAGFYLEGEETEDDMKDGTMILESIRSLMCRHYGMYHPFQDISENIFTPLENEDGMKISESINLTFKKEEDKQESE